MELIEILNRNGTNMQPYFKLFSVPMALGEMALGDDICFE